jgi:hypothetical protein
MHVPFTTEQFFEVFRRYNEAVWPAQFGLYALALIAVALAARGSPRTDRIVAGILALLWLWMGVVYHLMFFRAINPAAVLFGALFVAQAGLFAWNGVFQTRLAFRPQRDWTGLIGGLFLLYGLVAYPVLGYLLGHRYPSSPTFGLPCPTTIFTFGLLFWAARPIPRAILIIPILWSALGVQAAIQLGVREDLGLFVAGAAALVLLFQRDRRNRGAPQASPTG